MKQLTYALNPPQGEAQFYNTRGGMYTEYMDLNGDWFFRGKDATTWIYTKTEPPIKTKIGEVEELRVWYPQEQKRKEYKTPDYPEYYVKGQRYD